MSRSVEPQEGKCDNCNEDGVVYDLMGDLYCGECLAPQKRTIDCRSEEGITIGLIDAIISICRILRPRLEKYPGNEAGPQGIEEALRDLATDEDFRYIIRQYEWMRL